MLTFHLIPSLTGVSAERHWLGVGGDKKSSQIIPETTRRGEMGWAAFKRARQVAPNPILTF